MTHIVQEFVFKKEDLNFPHAHEAVAGGPDSASAKSTKAICEKWPTIEPILSALAAYPKNVFTKFIINTALAALSGIVKTLCENQPA